MNKSNLQRFLMFLLLVVSNANIFCSDSAINQDPAKKPKKTSTKAPTKSWAIIFCANSKLNPFPFLRRNIKGTLTAVTGVLILLVAFLLRRNKYRSQSNHKVSKPTGNTGQPARSVDIMKAQKEMEEKIKGQIERMEGRIRKEVEDINPMILWLSGSKKYVAAICTSIIESKSTLSIEDEKILAMAAVAGLLPIIEAIAGILPTQDAAKEWNAVAEAFKIPANQEILIAVLKATTLEHLNIEKKYKEQMDLVYKETDPGREKQLRTEVNNWNEKQKGGIFKAAKRVAVQNGVSGELIEKLAQKSWRLRS